MLNFNKVVVDAKANKLTVGGGVRFGDILGPMTQAKKEMGKYSRLLIIIIRCLRLGSDWSGELCGYDWSHTGWWCQSIQWTTRYDSRLIVECQNGYRGR
jgi:hypothetical protein